jgi:hypothetical protein
MLIGKKFGTMQWNVIGQIFISGRYKTLCQSAIQPRKIFLCRCFLSSLTHRLAQRWNKEAAQGHFRKFCYPIVIGLGLALLGASSKNVFFIALYFSCYTNVIYNLRQLIINLTVVDAYWKEVWYNAVKRNWTITYFTLVLIPLEVRIRIPLKFTWGIRGVRWG